MPCHAVQEDLDLRIPLFQPLQFWGFRQTLLCHTIMNIFELFFDDAYVASNKALLQNLVLKPTSQQIPLKSSIHREHLVIQLLLRKHIFNSIRFMEFLTGMLCQYTAALATQGTFQFPHACPCLWCLIS